ncbi:cysteine synthase A [Kroppenstedtia pulmonis]|uniref:Cysteine synthase n=1 Tax=Kroppenstedtia pulmonis TaxID=1380685 RepID=A0A7D3XQT9_9BACL|nr:cysteine synthase A [Kroppenstedtia pulmonis]QKG83768.1 cysteine synthase A [Kroppenstedtia pulmonis]
MKQVFGNIKELIGNTPIVRVNGFKLPEGVRIFAKLEYLNPGGSVKDRLGMALIQAAEREGKLKPGGTIIEPTAGNTGIGLALAAVGTGYQVIFVVPSRFSEEKQELMRALGAKVVNTPRELGIKGAIAKAKELEQEIEGSYCPQQFANPANPEVHYQTTGPEIWDQMEGRVDVLVAGAGSGGTFMGVARYLKEQNPDVKTVIVEPQGSILGGGEPGPHKTEGIGMEFLPDYMNPAYFDAVHTVLDRDAFKMVRELASREGMLVASSSGAAFYAALQEAESASAGTNIVVLFPDGSDRYLSQNIYQEEV